MSTELEQRRKTDNKQAGRRKFTVKIMGPKREALKKRTEKDSELLMQKLMEEHLSEARHHKKKIEELTNSAIEELKKLHELSRKAPTLKADNMPAKTGSDRNNHKFGLDYELTNMKMIKKILALSTPFEAELCSDKEKDKPQKKRAVSPKKEKPQTKGRGTNTPTKILIIEDDATTIKIIQHILEQHDFAVEYTSDAEAGLKKAFKEKPALILLDIMLPGMDGFQLLTKLQSAEETSRIPVVILSSLAGEKDILKGLEKGATDYILKPFSPQILFFKIKKILGLKNEHLANNRHL